MQGFRWSVDRLSMVAVGMLLICGCASLLFCWHYFSNDLTEGAVLWCLMVAFIGVMGVLVFSSSLLLSLVFWEYLGFVRFLLILFYSNSLRFRGAFVTLASSRFGDVGLFLILGSVLGLERKVLGVCFTVSFLLVILTKSARYPFISWLLEAMRAPTPVRALVHSSTLVAAGVWFCLRYDRYIFGKLSLGIFIFSVISIYISG